MNDQSSSRLLWIPVDTHETQQKDRYKVVEYNWITDEYRTRYVGVNE